jgi:hypothetical protein
MTEQAQRQARAERRWWHKHRDSKSLFSEELRAAREKLKEGLKLEIYGHLDGEPVRRLLLEKTRCHVYYVIIERENLVRIVSVWGALRGEDPALG